MQADLQSRDRGVLIDGLQGEVEVGKVVPVNIVEEAPLIGLPRGDRAGVVAIAPAGGCARGLTLGRRRRHLREESLGHRPLVRGRARAGGCDPLEVAVALDRIDGGAARVTPLRPRRDASGQMAFQLLEKGGIQVFVIEVVLNDQIEA